HNIMCNTTIPISYQEYEPLSSCQFHALHKKIYRKKAFFQKIWDKQNDSTRTCSTNTAASVIHPQSMLDTLIEIMQQDLKIGEDEIDSDKSSISSAPGVNTRPIYDFQQHSFYCECRGSGVGCQ
ncbi:7320_t:CDS:1, partial [Dentiscutata erythropus]